ncbi:MAG: protein kinase [Ruminococcus sp.]|nr:protein kinase [Ruminococcus sp.]
MSKNYCPYCMTPVPEGESCSVCGLTSGTYIPSPHHLPPGTVLMNRYLVGRVLGEGGFGITYIGCDLRLELKVAIKEYYPVDRATRNASASLEVTNFIGPSAKSFERGKQKFLGEAQVMARMDKQQVIVSVRDFFEINNTAYIVMEYIEGITFRELVEKKGGKIPAGELFSMVEPLFHALSMMHENGLIHRDISPDNLMLENGKVRLLDFGCAREASKGTETMTIALKHGYAPIEQYQQKGQGPWTDIYALSATIYYCLTGKVPPQALDRITEDELLLPSKLGIDITEKQETALLKGMKLQPSRRFASAEEMWSALYTQTEEETTVADGETTTAEEEAVVAPRTVEGDELSAAAPRTVEGDEPTAAEPGIVEDDESAAAEPGTVEGDELSAAVPETVEDDEAAVVTPEPVEDDEPAAITPEAAADTEQSGTQHLTGNPDKKVKIFLGAGVAAICLIVICIVWISHSAEKGRVNVANQNTSSGEDENGYRNAGDQAAEGGSISVDIDEHIFDNAVMFTSGDDQEFQALMEDDSVESVIMECENIDIRRTVVTKPVLLSTGTFWYADSIVIDEGGYLQVEGRLSFDHSGYLKLCGDVLRLCVMDGGICWSSNAFIWLDDEANFVTVGDNGGEEPDAEHRFVFSETVFEKSNVYSATDFASLQQAVEAGGPISIDADITLEEDVVLGVPVRISEGVTVSTMQAAEGNWYNFMLETGSALINNGKLEGNLCVADGGTVINNGSLEMCVEENMRSASLWVEDASAVVNFGTMTVDDASRFWKDSLFINMGDVNCYEFYLVGGHMANWGNMTVMEGSREKESWFEILNGSIFWNKSGGRVKVEKAAHMRNGSWILNSGEMVVGYQGRFDNTLLMNDGFFQIENGAGIDENHVGIYYGGGDYDTGGADIKVHHTFYYDAEETVALAEVTSEEELLHALEDNAMEAVHIKADITAHTDITIRKPLVIDSGCSLTMADGAAILDYGNIIILREQASLRGSTITLQEDAQLCMEGSALIIEENGSLTLDNSILWGWPVSIELSEASFFLKNKAGLALENVSSLEVSKSEIILQNQSVFAMPPQYFDTVNINNSSIRLAGEGRESFFYMISDMDLTDCSLQIESGVFYNMTGNMNLRNCAVTIAPDGEFYSDVSNLSLLSGTAVHNEGLIAVSGWDENLFMVHGELENYGVMEFAIHMELSEPINNQQEVYYHEDYYRRDETDWKWEDTYVEGNVAIPR